MSNIIVSPSGGLIEFNTGVAGGETFFTSDAPIRLDATGGNTYFTGCNVGIGTNVPTQNLHIAGTMQLDNTVSNAFVIRLNGSYGLAYDHDSIISTNAGYDVTIGAGRNLLFNTYDGGFNEAMRLDTAGNVGIGTPDPDARLHISGLDESVNTNSLLVQNSGGVEMLSVDNDKNVHARNNLYVHSESISYRKLRLGWGSIYGYDAGNELTLGSVYTDGDANKIFICGPNADNYPSDTVQLQANEGLALYSGNTPFDPSGLLHVSGDIVISSGSVLKSIGGAGAFQSLGFYTPVGDAGSTTFTALELDGQEFFEPRVGNHSNLYGFNSVGFKPTADCSRAGEARVRFGDPADAYPEVYFTLGNGTIYGDTSRNLKLEGYNGIKFTKIAGSPPPLGFWNQNGLAVGHESPQYELHVSGSVAGTGVGSRITLNGTGYLLSGDSPAETQTLQQVCDNGNVTTTSVLIQGTNLGYIKALKERASVADYLSVSSSILALTDYNATNEYGIYVNNAGNFTISQSGSANSLTIDNTFVKISGYNLKFDSPQYAYQPAINLRGLENGDEVGIYSPATNKFSIVTDRTDRLVVDEVGNVGIGTATPDAKLHVEGSAHITGQLKLDYPHAGEGQILLRSQAGDYSNKIGAVGYDMKFQTRGTSQVFYFDFGGVHNIHIAGGAGTPYMGHLNFHAKEGLFGYSNVSLLLQSDDANSPATDGIVLNRTNRLTSASKGGISVWKYNDSEVARITTEGKVGIGTNDPTEKLHVYSGILLADKYDAASTWYNIIASDGTNSGVGTLAGIGFQAQGWANNTVKAGIFQKREGSYGRGSLFFVNNNDSSWTSATESDAAITIAPDRNVGIGSIAPTAQLDVVYGASKDGIFIKDEAGGAVTLLGADGSNNARARFYNGSHATAIELNANAGSATYFNAGDVGIGTTLPSGILHVTGVGASDTTNYGIISNLSLGSNSTNIAGYFSAKEASANYALKTVGFNWFGGNTKVDGYIDQRSDHNSQFGNIFVGDTTVGYIAGNGGDIVFAGDALGQGVATATFANIRGIKENSTYNNSLGALVFGTQDDAGSNQQLDSVSEKMRITSDGYVGIGTNAPVETLHVDGNILIPQNKALKGYYGGSVPFDIIGMDSSTDVHIYGPNNNSSDIFFDTCNGGVTGTRMMVKNDGNVGIGTTNPAYPLHVYGVGRPAVFESSNGSNITKFGNSTCGIATYNGLDINVNAANSCGLQTYGMPMTFWTSTGNGIQGAERLRIEEDGRVGIGIDSPIYGLDVHNTGIRLGGAANAWVFNNDWEGLIEFAGSDFLGVQAGAAGSVYLKGGRTLYLGSSKLDIGNMLTMVQNTVGGNSADLYCYGQLEWDLHSYYNEKFIINYNSGTGPSPLYAPAFVIDGKNNNGYVGIGLSNPLHRLHVSGSVAGTGVGGRITLNGTGYLLSGDSPAETQTLQQVCDNGAATDTAMGITGALTLANHIYKNVENSYLGLYGGSDASVIDGYIKIHGSSNGWGKVQTNIGYDATNSKAHWTLSDSTELMTLKGNGNLGLGTTAPEGKLQINTPNHHTFALRIGNDSYVGGNPFHELLMLNNGSLTWYLPDNGSTPSKFQFYSRDTATYPFTVDSDTARVGIGSASPVSELNISPATGSITFGGANKKNANLDTSIGLTDEAGDWVGTYHEQQGVLTTNGSTSLRGVWVDQSTCYAENGVTWSDAALMGFYSTQHINTASHRGTIANQYGFWATAGINSCGVNGTVTNAYGVRVDLYNNDSDGTVTNSYGVYIDDTDTAGASTNRYGIYSEGSATKNYFEGKIGIGTTSPANSSTLDVRGRVSVREASDGELQFGTSSTYTWMEAFDGSADRSPKLPITMNPWGGDVGIGTTDPSDTLDVIGATNPAIRVEDTTNNVILRMLADDSKGRVGTFSNDDFSLYSNSTERLVINSGGNVGIGVAAPSSKLHVEGSINSSATIYASTQFQLVGGKYWTLLQGNKAGTNSDLLFYRAQDATTSMVIQSGGNVGIGTDNPSHLLNVKDGDIYAQNSNIHIHQGYYIKNASNGNQKVGFPSDAAFTFSNVGVGIGITDPSEDLEVSGNVVIGKSHGPDVETSWLHINGYDEHGIELAAHGDWTRWRISSKVNGGLELYNSGNVSKTNQIYVGRANEKSLEQQGNIMVYSTGSVLRAGHNSTTYATLDIGVQDPIDAAHGYNGDAYIDVRTNTAPPSRFHFKKDGEFIASGVSVSGDVVVRGGDLDIGTNDLKGAANCKIEMDAANGFKLTNPNNAHGIDFYADDLTIYGGGIGYRKIITDAGDLSIEPIADLLLQEGGGNVGIGTTDPSTTLHVEGAIKGGFSLSAKSADFTLAAADNGTLINGTSNAFDQISISSDLGADFNVAVLHTGNDVDVVGSSSMIINGTVDGTVTLASGYQPASIVRLTTNTYAVFGNLA